MKIAYLGPEGTFTHSAALAHFDTHHQLMPMMSIAEVFVAVEAGWADYGVVPVENSTEGMVSYTLDWLLTSSLSICAEICLRIEHNLLSFSALDQITTLFAHQQALAQCRHWIHKNLPFVDIQALESNGRAVQMAQKNTNSAAIASRMASDLYAMPIIAHNIEDSFYNTTRFLVIGTEPMAATGRDKSSLVVSAFDKPGMLVQLLEPIARLQINMTRLESRPSRQGVWSYIFFIDIEGHSDDEKLKELFTEMKKISTFFKILGSYPRAC